MLEIIGQLAWVRAEATRALEQKELVAARLEPCELPLPFTQVHSATVEMLPDDFAQLLAPLGGGRAFGCCTWLWRYTPPISRIIRADDAKQVSRRVMAQWLEAADSFGARREGGFGSMPLV